MDGRKLTSQHVPHIRQSGICVIGSPLDFGRVILVLSYLAGEVLALQLDRSRVEGGNDRDWRQLAETAAMRSAPLRTAASPGLCQRSA
ncbi:hypothetical protein CEXT_100891 [Caerostris extrusa]|uniref:Uncharacterized protein n=1 Tax=Caerostris extrusa TaxID=172846 RepID=A0AAV4MDN6_CAEEX|nr:hypothetical protein CEXT_100891 [Caerostris extrusa]